MVRLQISQRDVVLIIMDYLREHNLINTLLEMEKECNTQLYKYPKELAFARNLILEGQWDNAEQFISDIFDQSPLFNQDD